MTKTHLIEAVAQKTKLTKKDSEAAGNAFLAATQEALVAGEKIQIVGFGTFAVKQRAARKGMNPQTKKKIDIPASKHLTFSAGKTIKAAINAPKKKAAKKTGKKK